MGTLTEQARDLQARAASDPIACAEYVACLRLARDELRSIHQRLRVHVAESQLLAALEAIDAEIASQERRLVTGPPTPTLKPTAD